MLREWDAEVETLKGEIERIEKTVMFGEAGVRRTLTTRRFSMVQAQLNFTSAVERIVQIARRPLYLLPREKSVVFWSAHYATRLHDWYSARSKLLTRMMWVKLIQTRLAGDATDSSLVMETDQLVDLAVRHAELAKTEKHLEEALRIVSGRQRELTTRYNQLGIAIANRAASASLQGRLGVDVSDAFQSPSARALIAFFRGVGQPPVPRAEDEWLSRVRSEFDQETESLMSICRRLVLSRLGFDKGSRSGAGSERLGRRFAAAMRRLEKSERLARDVLAPVPPVPLTTDWQPRND